MLLECNTAVCSSSLAWNSACGSRRLRLVEIHRSAVVGEDRQLALVYWLGRCECCVNSGVFLWQKFVDEQRVEHL